MFLTCEGTSSPINRLEQIPAIANLVASGGLTIFPMMKEDGEFLKKISGEDHMVRLSYVLKDEQGQICGISEPLQTCRGQIEKYQFKKEIRYDPPQIVGGGSGDCVGNYTEGGW